MDSVEVSGKTVEEAVAKALDQLGLTRDEVEITVLKEGRSGILGLGAEGALVRVSTIDDNKGNVADTGNVAEPGNIAEVDAREVIEKLLDLMGLTDYDVASAEPPVTPNSDNRPVQAFDIKGRDLGILIGRRGQTLSCLQYIVQLIVSHQTKDWAPLSVDVEGYKRRRYEMLPELAKRMADQVRSRQMSFAFEPMSAYERRIIHLALADDPDVTTESTGEGDSRKVVIIPKQVG